MSRFIEYRKNPVNLETDDVNLFSHQLECQLSSPELRNYKNVYFNSEGYVYQSFNIVEEPFRISNNYVTNNRLRNLIKCLFLTKGNIKSKSIFIHDFWTEGYFHWHTEALAKLFFIQQKLSSDEYKLIIPAHYLGFKYIQESLAFLGYGLHNIIQVQESSIYKCADITNCNLFSTSGNYNSSIIRGLAEKLQAQVTSVSNQNKYIYISRSKVQKRRIVNEAAVKELMLFLGFQIVYPESLSYSEQIELFKSAKWLVTIHGAGLTNMMFMTPESNILELREENDNHNNCYFSLASSMNHNYFYLKCKSVDKSNDHIGDLSVDIEKLQEILINYV